MADPPVLPPELLLQAYAAGLFPMAESAEDDGIHWVEPSQRGVLPLDGLRISRSLAKVVRAERFEITVNRDFSGVVAACAAPAAGRESTWINRLIHESYALLHARGHAHSLEVWQQGTMVGGLYGVALGAAFFGESMFHRARDASKVALVHLVARLRHGGFLLLDTQFVTDHLASLGAVAMGRAAYRRALDHAVGSEADFFTWPAETPMPGALALTLAAPRNRP